MNDETSFYRELGTVPELPADCYTAVEREIRRKKTVPRILFALAASIVLVIGSLQIVTHNQPQNNGIQEDVASELQIISDYLNSNDLEGDIDLYAVVEGY